MSSSSSSSRAPAPSRGGASAAGGSTDPNTTFVQADPATFRALVQRLTGAPGGAAAAPVERQQQAAVFAAVPLPMRRPKLQERRRATPGRLDLSLARPQPFYYHHHHHQHHHHGLMQYSPVSTMDYAHVLAVSSSSASSPSPSPPSSCSCGVVISKEEEEREEKAIASKAFYLHSSPRSASTGGEAAERPKLLPLFPVHSPRSSSFA